MKVLADPQFATASRRSSHPGCAARAQSTVLSYHSKEAFCSSAPDGSKSRLRVGLGSWAFPRARCHRPGISDIFLEQHHSPCRNQRIKSRPIETPAGQPYPFSQRVCTHIYILRIIHISIYIYILYISPRVVAGSLSLSFSGPIRTFQQDTCILRGYPVRAMPETDSLGGKGKGMEAGPPKPVCHLDSYGIRASAGYGERAPFSEICDQRGVRARQRQPCRPLVRSRPSFARGDGLYE